MSSVVLALVVSVAAIVMTARRRPRRHAAAPIAAAEQTLSRLLRVMVRALGVAFAAATLALCFSQGASAESEEPPAEPATGPGQGAEHANENSAHADETEAAAEPSASEPPAVEEPPAAEEAPVSEPPAADETPAAEPPAAAVAPEPAVAEPTATEAADSTATRAAEPAGTPPSDATPAADPASDSDSTPAATEDPAAATSTGSEATAESDSATPTAARPWSINLRGAATIRTDGQSITIDFSDPSIPDETRPLSQISNIVVTGSNGADALTVGGQLGTSLSFDGGPGDDALNLAGGSTVRMSGSRKGEVLGAAGATELSFAGVDDVFGGSAGTTYLVGGPSDLRRLNLGPTDRLVVDLASQALLRLQEIILDGKLEIRGNGNAIGSALQFLAFASSSGDFADFSGLDRGHGGYFRPVNDGSGYGLDQANLPDGIVITFENPDDTDALYQYLSGKGNTLAPGTEVTIDVLDHEITGDLTLGGTPDAATLGLDGAQLRYGDSGSPLYVLTDADGASLLLTRTNLSGQLSGSVTTAIPGVTFDGTFTVDLDSDDGAITATGTGITVTMAGHTFTGVDLSLTGVQGAGGRSVVVTGGNGATVMFGGAGGPLLATLLGDLQLLLTAAGAELTAPVSLTSVVPGLAAPTGTFQLRLDSEGARLTSDAATLPIAGGSLSGAMTLYGVVTQQVCPASYSASRPDRWRCSTRWGRSSCWPVSPARSCSPPVDWPAAARATRRSTSPASPSTAAHSRWSSTRQRSRSPNRSCSTATRPPSRQGVHQLAPVLHPSFP